MQERANVIDPATAEVLRAMSMINPVTPDGMPTVAATVLDAASQMGSTQMSPSVGQAAEQAGIAAQLQAMKLQQAQEALMNQAMSGGVETLNPNIQGYAEGGIVGYAGDVDSYAMSPSTIDPETFRRDMEMMNAAAEARRAERERRDQEARLEWLKTAAPEVAARVAAQMQGPAAAAPAPRADIPPPPAPPAPPAAAPRPSGAAPVARAPGLATSSEPAFKQIFEAFEKYKGMSRAPTQQQTIDEAMATRAAREQFARMTGNDPELMTKMAGEYERIYTDQLNKIEARRAAAQERADRGGIAAWLRGFRQMQGQGIGEGFRTASEAGAAFDEAMRGRIERLEDMSLEIQRTRMEKINALRQQKYATDMGDFATAQKKGQDAAEAARREQLMEIELMKSRAEIQSQEARTAATLASQAADRAAGRAASDQSQIEELYRLRLSTLTQGKPPTPEQMMQAREYALQAVRGAGSAARTGVAAGNLDLARQKLAESNPIYRLNQFTAQNPKATEAERSRAIQTMREIEARAGLGGIAPVTGGGGQFKVIDVQPAPR